MKRYRLLIVDDEALIRSGLRARIAFFNFPDLDVDEAGSGAEALRRFGESEYGIAIVDISMPDMNGLELVERAKALGARTRFVLLSGYAEFGYAQKAITLGVRAYLNKPVSNDALRAQIEELLEELRAEEADSGRASAPDPEKELNQILSEGLRGGKPEDAYPALWSRCPEAFGGGWFYLGILHITAPSGRAQVAAARNAVREAVAQAPCDCGLLVVNCYPNAQRLYALFFDTRPDGLRRQVERAFLAARQGLERRMNVRLTLGVSRLCRALSAECEADARVALRQRRLYGRSNLYFFEDIREYEAQPFPEADLELLRKHMQRGDRAGANRQLEALFSEERVAAGRAMYLHVLWVRVVGLMLGTFNGLDDATMNYLLTQIGRVESIGDREEILREDLQNLAQHLRAHPEITAVFASEYNVAWLVRCAAEAVGLRVPEDLSIVCFDMPTRFAQGDEFTHVQQDEEGLGQKAVDLLLQRIADGPEFHPSILLPAAFIPGRSTAMPKATTRTA